MSKIAIILGSTRPGRNGEAVARWVLEQAAVMLDQHVAWSGAMATVRAAAATKAMAA